MFRRLLYETDIILKKAGAVRLYHICVRLDGTWTYLCVFHDTVCLRMSLLCKKKLARQLQHKIYEMMLTKIDFSYNLSKFNAKSLNTPGRNPEGRRLWTY